MSIFDNMTPEDKDYLMYDPHPPDDVFMALAEDVDPWCRLRVAENHYAPPLLLAHLSTYDESKIVQSCANSNPSLPLWRILELMDSHDEEERTHAASNPSLPYECVVLLSNDPVDSVQYAAHKELIRRNNMRKMKC